MNVKKEQSNKGNVHSLSTNMKEKAIIFKWGLLKIIVVGLPDLLRLFGITNWFSFVVVLVVLCVVLVWDSPVWSAEVLCDSVTKLCIALLAKIMHY